jgi:quercetin dioxygenase-like cupin family protein
MKTLLFAPIFLALLITNLSAQEMADKPIVSKATTQKYAPMSGVPDCATLAVLRGDPSQGPSIIEMKLTTGCIIPWHWHNTGEGVTPLSGLFEVSMKDDKPVIIANGDYIYLPAKHIHQAKCSGSKPCAIMLAADAAFDIHYVDKSGAEIPADKAIAEAEKLMTKQGAKPSH